MTNGALKRLWKEAKHYCGTFVEELMKTMKGLRIAGALVDIRTENFQNASLEPLAQSVL
jgi:hypothetical protein